MTILKKVCERYDPYNYKDLDYNALLEFIRDFGVTKDAIYYCYITHLTREEHLYIKNKPYLDSGAIVFSRDCVDDQVIIPLHMIKEFGFMRCKFGDEFFESDEE